MVKTTVIHLADADSFCTVCPVLPTYMLNKFPVEEKQHPAKILSKLQNVAAYIWATEWTLVLVTSEMSFPDNNSQWVPNQLTQDKKYTAKH